MAGERSHRRLRPEASDGYGGRESPRAATMVRNVKEWRVERGGQAQRTFQGPPLILAHDQPDRNRHRLSSVRRAGLRQTARPLCRPWPLARVYAATALTA